MAQNIESNVDFKDVLRWLPQIKNYYAGLKSDFPSLPTNVVQFVRREPKMLVKNFRSHHHRFALICNLKTAGRVDVDDESYQLRPGQALLVRPYQLHSYADLESNELEWVFILFEMPPDSFGYFEPFRNRLVPLHSYEIQYLKLLTQEFSQKYHENATCNTVILLTALFLECLRQKCMSTGSQNFEVKGKLNSAFVNRVQNWVYLHLEQKSTLKDLARDLGISRSLLTDKFKKEVGVSLGSYIRSVRIRKATCLIRETSMNFSEISQKCGFESLFSFSRTFKKAAGYSPREFRKKALTWTEPSPSKRS